MAEIKAIGVVGSGQMGSGIAQLAAVYGLDVWLLDTDTDALSRATKSISTPSIGSYSKAFSLRLGEMGFTVFASFIIIAYLEFLTTTGTEAMKRLQYTTNLEFLHSADFIIEAIVESEDVKKTLFRKLDKIAKRSAIFASNASSFSITRIASATSRPSQVIGMHFMNPPPIMTLVEVIRGADTSDETFHATKYLAEKFGKTVVCSQDYSGFIINRILMTMLNEAFFTLYTGVATKEDIDTGMKLGTYHPMVPLELADFIGLDVCLSILKVLHTGLGDSKYSPCPLLVQFVDVGRLGRKSGIGMYDYQKVAQKGKPSPKL